MLIRIDMKKIVCAILLFSCIAGYCYAQKTIEYCCTYSYKNGVKVKTKEPYFRYITFKDNYNRIYISDEYGNCTDCDPKGRPQVYKYIKAESDYNIYEADNSQYDEVRTYYVGNSVFTSTYNPQLTMFRDTYKISQDLSVINVVPCRTFSSLGISVYKRVTKAEKEAILREYEESLPKLLQ